MIRRVLLIGLFTFPLIAQPAPDPNEPEHQALRQIRAAYERAVNEDRLDLLKPYFAEPFYGVMITSKRVSTLDEMRQYWVEMKKLIGAGGTYHVTVEPEKSTILGDFALARGTTKDTVKTGDGNTYEFGTNWTATLHKENGAWKVLQVQGSMDPVGNAFAKAYMNEAAKRVGASAAAGGLVVGLLIGWLAARRRKPALA